MIQNSWQNITLICGNHGDDHTHEMHLQEGPHSLFYACPEYRSIYGDDHEKRSCNNRLTLVDYEKCLEDLLDLAYGNDAMNLMNLTGYSWTKNGVYYEVLKQDGDHFTVLMKNNKAIAK